MDGRHGSSGSQYRYGFQGQEMDDEVKGKGNSVNYKYRMHDPRIGRFFAVDPLAPKYPHYTPYQFSGNKVIAWKELEGLEETGGGQGSIDKTQPHPDATLTSSTGTVTSESSSESITVTSTYSYTEYVSIGQANGTFRKWLDENGYLFSDGTGADLFGIARNGYSNNSEYGHQNDWLGSFQASRTHTWTVTSTVYLKFTGETQLVLVPDESSASRSVTYKGYQEKVSADFKVAHNSYRSVSGAVGWRIDKYYTTFAETTNHFEETTTTHPNIIGADALGLVSDVYTVRTEKNRTYHSWPNIAKMNGEFDALRAVANKKSNSSLYHSGANMAGSIVLGLVEASSIASTGGILLVVHGIYILVQDTYDKSQFTKRMNNSIDSAQETAIKEATKDGFGTTNVKLK